MYSDVELARLLLLGEAGKCMECRYCKDIWLLADNLLFCTKQKQKTNMDSTCKKWNKTTDEEIMERNFYFYKYKEDAKFIEMVKKTEELLRVRNASRNEET